LIAVGTAEPEDQRIDILGDAQQADEGTAAVGATVAMFYITKRTGKPDPGMLVNGNVTVNNTDITAIDDKREALKAFQSMRASAMIVDASTPDQSR